MFSKKKGYKLFIVEGENREKNIFEIMMEFPFPWDDSKFVTLPAEQNIYMIWNTMKEDDFETDILEILKEKVPSITKSLDNISVNDIEEIYLFFDYDAHQKNLPIGVKSNDVIDEMLNTFSNETELGKLYISYPMVEVLRDWTDYDCQSFTNCTCNINDFKNYKALSGNGNIHANIEKYNYPEWKTIVNDFLRRISCLFDYDHILTYEEYRKLVSPQTIFAKQKEKFICDGKIFLLSAIPEFLLDYFNEKFWKKWIKINKIKLCKLKK